MSTFNNALEAWQAGAELRARRRRYKNYTYGRQWDDPATDADHRGMTEFEVALINGQTPQTNNLIRQLVKCVIGNFRSQITENDPAADSLPDAETAARNALAELDCRMLEEFLISGCAIQRVVMEKRPAGSGAWVDNVSPDDFFVNHFKDPRGLDIELVGMLHSMSMRETMMRYGSCRRDNAARIARAYGHSSGTLDPQLPLGRLSQSHFFKADCGRCRIIEVWTMESRNMLRCHDPHESRLFITDLSATGKIAALNSRRQEASVPTVETHPFTSVRWHCRIYTPFGEMLDEYDSPFAHGMHPFVLKFYPLIDGEVHSLVEDIIDQQRHVNSLITLIDQIMRVSAKGVLLFPADQLPERTTLEDVAEQWAKPTGIIAYDPRNSSHEPHQIAGVGEPAGAYRMLETHLQLFQQVSGVSEALQGRLTQARTSAALYDSQLRTSAVALLDLMDSFNSFRCQRNSRMANLVNIH